jgi:excisionase family DNA binding protein
MLSRAPGWSSGTTTSAVDANGAGTLTRSGTPTPTSDAAQRAGCASGRPCRRPMRFHDLRHTTATLLLHAGVPLHHVQRIMRHKDVRLTTETYGHLVADDLRDAVERIAPAPSRHPSPPLRGDAGDRVATALLPAARFRKAEGRTQGRNRPKIRPSKWSGRQDLNLRPLGPEGSTRGSDTVGSGPAALDESETTGGRGRGRSDTDRLGRRGLAASVTFRSQRTLGTCRLLTVHEVAVRLRVSRATVYRLVAEGRIPAVRISSGAIRVPVGAPARGDDEPPGP